MRNIHASVFHLLFLGIRLGFVIVIITFYSPSCLVRETAKRPFGLRVKLPPVYQTPCRLHTVPLISERQAKKLEIPVFIVFGLTRPGIEFEFGFATEQAHDRA